jgi:hypothetical protein
MHEKPIGQFKPPEAAWKVLAFGAYMRKVGENPKMKSCCRINLSPPA